MALYGYLGGGGGCTCGMVPSCADGGSLMMCGVLCICLARTDELVSVSYFEVASGTVHTELCTLSGAGQAKLLLKAGECLGF